MYYDKRIRYLSYYESDIKLQNAGYAKFQVRDSLCQMVVYVKGPRLMGSGEAAVYLLSRKREEADDDSFYPGGRDSRMQKHLLGNLSIRGGQGHCAVRMNAENMADSGLRYDEICGIRIEMHEYQYLESQWNVVNFMPARQVAQDGKNMGYQLRQQQPRQRDSVSGDEQVKVDLIVTPVSENVTVEKLIREESPAEPVFEEVRRGEILGEEPVEESDTADAKAEGTEEEGEGEPLAEWKRTLAEEIMENRDLAEKAEVIAEEKQPDSPVSVEETAEGKSADSGAADSMQEMLEREVRRSEQSGQSLAQPMQSPQPEGLWQQEQNFGEAKRSVEQEMQSKAQFEQPMQPGESFPSEQPADQEVQPDKWEQLRNIYPIVHPIREEEEYLKVSPKDFVIFTEKYQQLVRNSFLLHGYHNYKHLILGKKEKGGKVVYYLGVPGTFHDREKAVAVMFGFEAFDGKREPAQNGDFGYYLRRVEI